MATVTKVINPLGAIGVNCDFNTISAWWTYVCAQTNPDQQGVCYGDMSGEFVTLALNVATNFTSPTSQHVCPRLIAAYPWMQGSTAFGTQLPVGNTKIGQLDIINGGVGANGCKHFKVYGLELGELSSTLGEAASRSAQVWFDRCSFFTIVNLSTNPGFNFSVKWIFTSCLFPGDSSDHSGYATLSNDSGSSFVLAFIGCVVMKGFDISDDSAYTTDGTIVVQATCEMWVEGIGFGFNISGVGTINIETYSNAANEDYSGNTQISTAVFLQNEEFMAPQYFYTDYHLTPEGIAKLQDMGGVPFAISGFNLDRCRDIDGLIRPIDDGDDWDIGIEEVDGSELPEDYIPPTGPTRKYYRRNAFGRPRAGVRRSSQLRGVAGRLQQLLKTHRTLLHGHRSPRP